MEKGEIRMKNEEDVSWIISLIKLVLYLALWPVGVFAGPQNPQRSQGSDEGREDYARLRHFSGCRRPIFLDCRNCRTDTGNFHG